MDEPETIDEPSLASILGEAATIRIGVVTYLIERVDARGRMTNDSLGHCMEGVLDGLPRIAIPDFSTPLAVETLWHEVSHAIHSMMGLGDSSSEEDYADRASKGWLIVLRDNPWLVDLLYAMGDEAGCGMSRWIGSDARRTRTNT